LNRNLKGKCMTGRLISRWKQQVWNNVKQNEIWKEAEEELWV
jgi:hypothetical protein